MNVAELTGTLSGISYKQGWKPIVDLLHLKDGFIRAYWVFERPDAITGEPGLGQSGDAFLRLEPLGEESFVRRMFKLALDCEEHECREFFQYRGERPFWPHKKLIRLSELEIEGGVV